MALSIYSYKTIKIQENKLKASDICGECKPGNLGPYMLMKKKTFEPQLEDNSTPKLFEQVTNGEFIEGQNVNDIEAKTYDKVFYDSEYIQVDVRKFPAVTGGLGNYRVISD